MKRIFLLILVLATASSLTACTQPDEATSILRREGYEFIDVTGYAFFGCSEDDVFRTGFTAVKNGVKVDGVVCSGWFKGYTVRTFN